MHPTLELRFSCSNLNKLDWITLVDPQIIAFENKGLLNVTNASHTLTLHQAYNDFFGNVKENWLEIGRTEVFKDEFSQASLSKFMTSIFLNFIFEKTQILRFYVIDVKSKSEKIEENDLLGFCQLNLSSIGMTISEKLQHPNHKQTGWITITANEVFEKKLMNLKLVGMGFLTLFAVRLQFSGRDLDRKDLLPFGKSDSFYIVNYVNDKSELIPILKSEVVKKNLNPNWLPKETIFNDLCRGNESAPLLIEIFHFIEGKEPSFIGRASTTLGFILHNKNSEIELINPDRKKSKISGYLKIKEAILELIPSIIDYFKDGFELDFTVSIDFSILNGNPQDPKSLHYLNPNGGLNDYQKVINSVGTIIDKYNTHKHFSVMGFGATLNSNYVSHYFALNGKENLPQVYGIEGILGLYSRSLPHLKFSGPTILTPTIEKFSNQIQSNFNGKQQSKKYHVLLIITTGEISDVDRTLDAILRASDSQLSIVIVGVGWADFEIMRQLDTNQKPHDYLNKSNEIKRDFVRFLPFRELSDPVVFASQ
ncbi:Copine-1, partial [Nowakowskiella sp. JEL0078]